MHPSSPSLTIVHPLLSSLFPVKNGKNKKPHVLTLQDKEQDSLQFDLAADSLEELFAWYQVGWDITQREMNKQYNREQEVGIRWYMIIYGVEDNDTSVCENLEAIFYNFAKHLNLSKSYYAWK